MINAFFPSFNNESRNVFIKTIIVRLIFKKKLKLVYWFYRPRERVRIVFEEVALQKGDVR